ncbi:hypothetical protein NVP1215B_068 [Vibrio phage 1.215.B._10N.222.54.F7]|nr:hypothetical protein NVP1215A_068 [Vibrio phage 1.215.A._10N.222.54.F7]AUR96091.1 hypothetical protein NVP1215B_068 [Vibrio phage 1.215.B._10N.222.54.F7]
MSDSYNRVNAVLKAATLTDDVTLIEYMKTTQLTIQAYNATGDPIPVDPSITVTVTPRLVGNPQGDAHAAITLGAGVNADSTLENKFLESMEITATAIPASTDKVVITVMQSVY